MMGVRLSQKTYQLFDLGVGDLDFLVPGPQFPSIQVEISLGRRLLSTRTMMKCKAR